MDVFDAILERRSIRNFKQQQVEIEVVETLIEAARWAPSAGNVQPWEFIIVYSDKSRQELSKAALGQKVLEQAPVVIVVCVDEGRAEESYGLRGKTLYCLQDTGAAIQNMLLIARAMELGTCWVGAFDEAQVRLVINAPACMRPVALVPVGVPNEAPKARSRRPLNEIVHKETL